MPSRTARYRWHKSLELLRVLPEPFRSREMGRRLAGFRREAEERAENLGAPAVWSLAKDEKIMAVVKALDSKGEAHMLEDLNRICAEAIAHAVDRRMVRGASVARPR